MSRHTSARLHSTRALIFSFSLIVYTLLPQSAAAKAPDPALVETQATEIVRNIVQGITEGDYQKYTRDFSDAMRKSSDHESFLQLQSNLRKHVGKFKSMAYIGFYSQEGFLITLFKARFSKEKDDVLVNLVLDRHKDPKVTGLWFEAPSLRK